MESWRSPGQVAAKTLTLPYVGSVLMSVDCITSEEHVDVPDLGWVLRSCYCYMLLLHTSKLALSLTSYHTQQSWPCILPEQHGRTCSDGVGAGELAPMD